MVHSGYLNTYLFELRRCKIYFLSYVIGIRRIFSSKVIFKTIDVSFLLDSVADEIL